MRAHNLFARAFIVLLAVAACISAQTVTVGTLDEISTVDPLTPLNFESGADRLRTLMFDSLVTRGESLQHVGELAASFTTDQDGTTLRFHLRERVRFHDGRPLTSADVRYTFDTLFESKGYRSSLFLEYGPTGQQARIISYRSPDARTFLVTVARPALIEQVLSALAGIPIVPVGSAGEIAARPVGTGPFRFAGFDKSSGTVELDANPDYWGGPPKIAKLVVRPYRQPEPLEQALRFGAFDLLPSTEWIPSETLASLEADPRVVLQVFPGTNIQYLGFNTESPVLRDVRVRRAIAHAIDRRRIVDAVLLGRADIAHSVLPERSWAYASGHIYDFDIAEAKRLLEAAKYRKQPVILSVSISDPVWERIARAIQSSLALAGVNAVIEPLEVSQLRSRLMMGEFQMSLGAWIQGNQDPVFLKDLFSSRRIPTQGVSCCNRWRYRNRAADAIIDRATVEPDMGKKRDLYAEAWNMVSADVPMLPLWYPSDVVVVANDRIGDVKASPNRSWRFLKDVTIVPAPTVP